jgi:copper(I)-binding protein
VPTTPRQNRLQEPLEEGDQVPLTLVFEKAGEVTIQVPVRGIAMEPAMVVTAL